MFVDHVSIHYVDGTDIKINRGQKFTDSTVTSIEINEENYLIKLILSNKTVVSFPMTNMSSYACNPPIDEN